MADQEYNPETGQVEADSTTGAGKHEPRRRWGRKEKGGYDARFDYEGATVYIRLLGRADWKFMQDQEEPLNNDSKAVQELGHEVEANAKLSDGHPDKWTDEVARQRRHEFHERTLDLADRVVDFQHGIVKRSVVGWKGAPIPFSPEALEDLPREMIVEWCQAIMEKSRLGRSEAENLPPR